jgi:uncharacterized protein (DUF2235 family)
MWDTVRSYGGVKQRTFLHLRHNPIVQIVRQALALDESRSWFRVSSWGRTDSDRPSDERRYQTQDIMEVWFRGSHSVVGGSDRPDASTNLALRVARLD